jgi:cytochrome c556
MIKAALTLACLPLAACAAGGTQTATAAPAAGPGSQQIVAARQAAFGLTASTFGALRGAVEGGGDLKPVAGGARNIARWADAIPGMFPEGTQLPTSKAKAEIWQNRAGFEARAAALATAARALADAAESGDRAALGSRLGAVGQACGACHQAYRVETAS